MDVVPQESRFFRRPEVKAAIDAIAKSDHITMFVGLGASIESDLPTWEDLIRGLLAETVPNIAGGATGSELAAALVDRFGPVVSAGMAQARTEGGDDLSGFYSLVRDQLYARVKGRPLQPGRLTQKIAEVALLSPDPSVITTNYDNLLELALRQAMRNSGLDQDVVTVHDGAGQRPSGVPVYHIHGYLPYEGDRSSHLVITERDYLLQAGGDTWYRELLEAALTDVRGTCVFVGSSLTDPNLVRYLHEAARSGGANVYALLPRQGEGWSAMGTPPSRVLEEYIDDRLASFGVHAVHPDFFAQVAQFLNEVFVWRSELMRQGGGRIAHSEATYSGWSNRYGQRIDRWRSAFEVGLSVAPARGEQAEPQYRPEEFVRAQGVLHERLARALREIHGILERQRGAGLTEALAIHLWVRDPTTYRLEQWANTATMLREPRVMPRPLVSDGSHYQAVRAWCIGTPEGTDLDEASRWGSVHAIPVYLEGEPWNSLPVGVITLSSSETQSHSRVWTVNADKRRRVWDALLTAGRDVLTPAPAPRRRRPRSRGQRVD